MTLTFEVSDRLYEAAQEWADRRLEEIDEAMETKVEQALLEIEHLVSQSHDVAFEVDGREIRYDPTAELAALLRRQAEESGLDESTVLKMHVDLYANTFLDEVTDEQKPPGTPSE
ncbi:hypothetical protein [Haloarcula japonica]|uniref:Uncharacterized protein n=1 Tax=Haloarcula japonica (strain ATCC 49778 / DSM 6131 / JCM 7785 / NBRC 101032 / NCIMB 13157 / TR-1) TaxID=1227453 RepID=M0LKJ7_HALJT|nr:hypothetical protein [Haloarcula japonica]EMA32964.1 hypothetical protein C444_07066 [Haloarcula japonica DSM 6131]